MVSYYIWDHGTRSRVWRSLFCRNETLCSTQREAVGCSELRGLARLDLVCYCAYHIVVVAVTGDSDEIFAHAWPGVDTNSLGISTTLPVFIVIQPSTQIYSQGRMFGAPLV